jgi:hypothetical protein
MCCAAQYAGVMRRPAPQLPAFDVVSRTGTMAALKGSKTVENLKYALAGVGRSLLRAS